MSRPISFSWFVLGILLLAGCGKKDPAGTPTPPPREITVAIPLQDNGMDWDDYTGRVDAVERVEIRSRVDGYLTDISFREGDIVKKGDLLFVIDPRPYETEVQRFTAELERVNAQLALAKQEFDRAESLHKTRAIAASDYDAKATALLQAKALIEAMKSNLARAKLNLEFCHIRAPISGRVGQRLVTQGNLIETGKQVLTTIVSQDPIYVYFNADENALLRYQGVSDQWATDNGGLAVELALANETGFPHKGKLDFVDNQVDPGTGTIRLRGVFDNAQGKLTPGLFARVRVPGSKPYRASLIPDVAIGTDQGKRFVLIINDKNVAEYRPVELGPLRNGLRVIREGLQPGERIATTGLQLIRPGTEVIPKPVSLEPTSGPGVETASSSSSSSDTASETP